MYSSESQLTFQRNILPPSSASKIRPSMKHAASRTTLLASEIKQNILTYSVI
jgi:hypothetical protein